MQMPRRYESSAWVLLDDIVFGPGPAAVFDRALGQIEKALDPHGGLHILRARAVGGVLRLSGETKYRESRE